MKNLVILAVTTIGLSFNAYAAEKSSNVPLQIDGVSIYAGSSSDSGYVGTEIARRACNYFGFSDVNSYSRGWSVEAAKKVEEVVIIDVDGSTRIIQTTALPGFNTYSKLVCE